MSKETLIGYLKLNGKDKSWEELAKDHQLVSGEAARSIWKNNKNKNIDKDINTNYVQVGDYAKQDTTTTYSTTFSEDIKKGTAEVSGSTKEELTCLEDVIRVGKVDIDKWEVTKYNQGYLNGRWNFRLTLELKETKYSEDKIIEFLDNYQSNHVPFTKNQLLTNNKFTEKSAVLISLPDFHLDKKTIDNQTIEDKLDKYNSVLDNLLLRATASNNVEEIVFVIGNDFFHTDNIHNTTTNGTPQDICIEWDKAYEIGFNLMVEAITKCKQFCNMLHVVLIQGNHPRTKEYYLAHGLEMYFKNDNSIHFQRDSDTRKVYTYGTNFIGLHHGNCKNDKLPLVFATEFPVQWGNSKYREIILGDKHHNSEKLFYTQNEVSGIRMRILPSLSGTDRWHNDNLFTGSIQSGVAIVYGEFKGKIGEYEWSV